MTSDKQSTGTSTDGAKTQDEVSNFNPPGPSVAGTASSNNPQIPISHLLQNSKAGSGSEDDSTPSIPGSFPCQDDDECDEEKPGQTWEGWLRSFWSGEQSANQIHTPAETLAANGKVSCSNSAVSCHPQTVTNPSSANTGVQADSQPISTKSWWPFSAWGGNPGEKAKPPQPAADTSVQPPESLSKGDPVETARKSWWNSSFWTGGQIEKGSKQQKTVTDVTETGKPLNAQSSHAERKPPAGTSRSWFSGWRSPGQWLDDCRKSVLDQTISQVISDITSRFGKFPEEPWKTIKPFATAAALGTAAITGATTLYLTGNAFQKFGEAYATIRGAGRSAWDFSAYKPDPWGES
ncbi:hypothetical protein DB88DRAFT_480716 [Papiliotrema laurentii]|uniref:Uncharacterized protein n=1 Tax=Papiliotrema laurentii TaxID=5418 RepID=A0AAD9L7D8_PAPLA|nr:hypothetical protein DB88DRAFT_480716 [Papiliotrema laurentii]